MTKKTDPTPDPTPAPEPTPTAAVGPPEPGGTKWTRMQDPTPAPQPEPEPTPAPAPEPVVKTFTQVELDQILKDRLDRERKKFEGYDDLKKKAAKLDDIEKSKLDETERLKLERDQERQRREQVEKEAQQEKISNALLLKLSGFQTDKGLGIRKDALDAALKLVDLSKINLEGGQVSGVDDAVSNLVEQHQFLLEQPRQTATSPTNPARTTPQGTSDKQRRARYFGGGQPGGFFDAQDNVVLPE